MRHGTFGEFKALFLCSNPRKLLVKKPHGTYWYLVRSVAHNWLNDYTEFIDLKRAGIFSILHALHSVNALRKYLPVKNPTDTVRWCTVATSLWECDGTCIYLTKWLAPRKRERKIGDQRKHLWYLWTLVHTFDYMNLCILRVRFCQSSHWAEPG